MTPPARRDGRRRSLVAVLFLVAACLPLAAPAASAPPKEAGPPSLEGRLSALAENLYAAAERGILAPARREAAAILADPRPAQIYRAVRDRLRQFGESATSRVLRPAAAGLAKFLGNARRAVEEWVRRELMNPFGKPPQTEVKTAGAAIAATPLPRPDLLKNAKGEDPFEPVNRIVFDMNGELQTAVFDPVTGFYLAHATPAVQASVRNFFGNLHEPLTVVASAFEGRFADAGTAAARFGINTTLGVGGLFDPAAARFGLRVKARSLEQALCHSGLPAGPYLVLPVLGPATVRDAAGRLATVVAYFEVMGVYLYVPYRLSDLALQNADRRDRTAFINSLSRDPYVAQRALYLTARELSCGEQAARDREFFSK
ncbi:MAG TPA: VacJ family lipoprotein [Stellaceae bacterium]|nr:VacJ family lipoprotein [Stellaceae bacterium]